MKNKEMKRYMEQKRKGRVRLEGKKVAVKGEEEELSN